MLEILLPRNRINSMEEKIDVLILCYTFNQEKYIEKALKSFVNQRTSFSYKALIVDDCSTDNTPNIIKTYEEKFPNIITGVYLPENYYSQNKDKTPVIQPWRDNAKYEALCEGDDWWIDDYKLQKQYDALEKHPEVDMCACETLCYHSGEVIYKLSPSMSDRILSLEETINGGGAFVGTNSLMYRTSLYNDQYSFWKIINLDYIHQIHGALRGGIYYISQPMAAYRVMTDGSWTSSIMNDYKSKFYHSCKVLAAITVFDKDTNFRFSNIVQKNQSTLVYSLIEKGLRCDVFDTSLKKSRLKGKIKFVYFFFKRVLNVICKYPK